MLSKEHKELLEAFGIDQPIGYSEPAKRPVFSNYDIVNTRMVRNSIDVLRSSGVGNDDNERISQILQNKKSKSLNSMDFLKFNPTIFYSNIPEAINEDLSSKKITFIVDAVGSSQNDAKEHNSCAKRSFLDRLLCCFGKN